MPRTGRPKVIHSVRAPDPFPRGCSGARHSRPENDGRFTGTESDFVPFVSRLNWRILPMSGYRCPGCLASPLPSGESSGPGTCLTPAILEEYAQH
jgi:hypothetical protein